MKMILAAMVLALASLVGFAPAPAQAGPACEWLGICGHVKLASSSNYNLRVTCDWNVLAANSHVLYPGDSDRCHDMDGVFIASGFSLWCRPQTNLTYARIFVGGGWNKTTDDFNKICQVRAGS